MAQHWWTSMPEPRDPRTPSGKRAIALGYDRGKDHAPRVLARGGGDVADRIVEAAQQHGIPIERDPDLLQCLQPLSCGAEIPVAAFEAVAGILAFLYRKNRDGSHPTARPR
jgi:flagellar biosynthesis protein